jgi:hypothetical protein
MAYRSELEAALARLEAMGPPRPCPACVARRQSIRRIGMFLLGGVLYIAAFVLLAFATIAGFIAILALLLGTLVLVSRSGSSATPFMIALGFALLGAVGFAAFAYLERLVAFDVGRFG